MFAAKEETGRVYLPVFVCCGNKKAECHDLSREIEVQAFSQTGCAESRQRGLAGPHKYKDSREQFEQGTRGVCGRGHNDKACREQFGRRTSRAAVCAEKGVRGQIAETNCSFLWKNYELYQNYRLSFSSVPFSACSTACLTAAQCTGL